MIGMGSSLHFVHQSSLFSGLIFCKLMSPLQVQWGSPAQSVLHSYSKSNLLVQCLSGPEVCHVNSLKEMALACGPDWPGLNASQQPLRQSAQRLG